MNIKNKEQKRIKNITKDNKKVIITKKTKQRIKKTKDNKIPVKY